MKPKTTSPQTVPPSARWHIRRFAHCALAAAYAADTLTRLFAYITAFFGGGLMHTVRVLFADADYRMLLSALIGLLLFTVGFSRRLTGMALRLTVAVAVVTNVLVFVFLHVALLPGQAGFYTLGILLSVLLLSSVFAAAGSVIRAYDNYTNKYSMGDRIDDRTT